MATNDNKVNEEEKTPLEEEVTEEETPETLAEEESKEDSKKGFNLIFKYSAEVTPYLKIIKDKDATEEDKIDAQKEVDAIHDKYITEYGLDKREAEARLSTIDTDLVVGIGELGLKAEEMSESEKSALKAYLKTSIGVKAAGLGLGIFQFLKGEKAEREALAKRPTPPKPMEREPLLEAEIAEVQRRAELGRPEIRRAAELAGAQAERELVEAGAPLGLPGYVSAVQAGKLGTQRLRTEAAFREEQMKETARTRLERLVGERMRETERMQAGREKAFYGYEYPEFQRELGAGQALGATGLQNIMNVLAGVPKSIYTYANIADFLDTKDGISRRERKERERELAEPVSRISPITPTTISPFMEEETRLIPPSIYG